MRFAQLMTEAGLEFVVGERDESSINWYLWKEIKKDFMADKLVQSIHNLDQFISHYSFIESLIPKIEESLRSKTSIFPAENQFRKAFSPLSFRDFYCFEGHVKKGRKSRGQDVPPEWYEAPFFYYSNHLSLQGPEADLWIPEGTQRLDFELEVGCVVGKEIYNASLEEARDAIFGYCLVNDWTARDTQSFEMKMGLGPHKGKDFQSNFGPYLISKFELDSLRKMKGFDLDCRVELNGELMAETNWSKIQYSFEEMLVRASKNCRVYPGELIASGTLDGGCLMEYNLDRDDKRWLKEGDVVRLSISDLSLELTQVVKSKTSDSRSSERKRA